MDTLSHGLWGSLAFGRRSKKSFWLAFFFGVAPDLFSFGPFFASTLLGFAPWPDFSAHQSDPNLIPRYVHLLYRPTHSLIIFSAAFLLVWLIRRKPLWEMSAWGLHVLYDIPLHDRGFFATPFLWPISSYTFNGWSWGHWWIFFPNVAVLTILYAAWWYRRRQQRKRYA